MLAKAFIASTLLTAALAFDALRVRQDDASLSSELASASAAASSASLVAAACSVPPSALSILESVPTPPADLASAIEAQAQTDPCKFSLTGSASAEYKSYTGEVLAWSKSNSAFLSSLESSLSANCPLATTGAAAAGVCTTGAGVTATAANGATATGSGGATATASKAAAAPQNTVMAVAAGAIAGAVGIIAAL